MLAGSCHCGALSIELATDRPPSDLPVRVCGCSFCLRHRPRYTSDPSGHLTIRAASESGLSRYRFGLRLADFLICRTCGVFVAAYESGAAAFASRAGEARARAVLNLEVLDRARELVGEATAFTAYDSEDAPTRSARRARAWTPATLVVGGSGT